MERLHLEDRLEQEAAALETPEMILKTMLSIRSVVPTTSSFAQRQQGAIGTRSMFREIGTGSAGKVFEHPGTIFAYKVDVSGQPDKLWNNYDKHMRVYKSFDSVPYVADQVEIPRCFDRMPLGRGYRLHGIGRMKPIPRLKKHALARVMRRGTPTHPGLTIEYLKPNNLYITLAWQAHVSLARHHEDDKPLTAQKLQSRLAGLRGIQAKFICTEVERGQQLELRLFDPNLCRCLRYAGMDKKWRHPLDEALLLRSPRFKRRPCYSDPTRRLDPLLRAQTDQPSGHDRINAHNRLQSEHRIVWLNYGLKNGKIDPFGHAEHGVIVAPCISGRDCIEVNYEMTMCLSRERGAPCMALNWFYYLDPDSHRLTEDNEGLGVYWCKEETCRNYYRYGLSRLHPFVKWGNYSQVCPE
ncbi:hypothetical protein B0T24DRAFT_596264 [Lasiosphaeria ovina]|uniref:Uncharacterized protein n=1 Tax=Lasiosphaeria ovina TaxID=92902 RepID=A0AAE0K4Z6_9PEZI|nr:hypothetical protein B0T24DRAFT_596264 [Lasiosphaeria ovina]